MIPKNSVSFQLIRIDRIHSDWFWIGFELVLILFGADTNSEMIWKISDWFGMNFNSKSFRNCKPNESGQSELIRINTNLQSECIRSIRMKQNFSESLELIRIDRIESSNWSDWLDSFGLKVGIHSDCKFEIILINSDWPNSFGLHVRIDFEWASDWFVLQNFFGLDRNEIVWFGYNFQNDSDNLGLIRNEFQSVTFARDL